LIGQGGVGEGLLVGLEIGFEVSMYLIDLQGLLSLEWNWIATRGVLDCDSGCSRWFVLLRVFAARSGGLSSWLSAA
jgi:hypothetical protein